MVHTKGLFGVDLNPAGVSAKTLPSRLSAGWERFLWTIFFLVIFGRLVRVNRHPKPRFCMFWSSPLFWIAFAVFLFWALGAYNRLMRLRSAVVQSFGNLDAHMVRLVALMGEFGAAQAMRRGSLVTDEASNEDAEAAALQGAANQLSASLAVARARPLHPGAMAALSAARDVLQATWHSTARKLVEPPMAIDAPMPQMSSAVSADAASVWQVRWDEYALQDEQATQIFNEAVRQYNAGVAQFPANMLAKVFGFKAACAL